MKQCCFALMNKEILYIYSFVCVNNDAPGGKKKIFGPANMNKNVFSILFNINLTKEIIMR